MIALFREGVLPTDRFVLGDLQKVVRPGPRLELFLDREEALWHRGDLDNPGPESLGRGAVAR